MFANNWMTILRAIIMPVVYRVLCGAMFFRLRWGIGVVTLETWPITDYRLPTKYIFAFSYKLGGLNPHQRSAKRQEALAQRQA